MVGRHRPAEVSAPGGLRVVVYHRVPAEGLQVLVDGHRKLRSTLDGTPGLLGDELLVSRSEPGIVCLVMYWADLPAFERWERDLHSGAPSPLRAHQDRTRQGGHYQIFTVGDPDAR